MNFNVVYLSTRVRCSLQRTTHQQLLKKKIFWKIISSKAYHKTQGTHQHTLRNNYRAQEIKWHNKIEAEIKTFCSIKTWLRLLWFFISMWFFLRRSFVFHLKSLELVFAYVQFTFNSRSFKFIMLCYMVINFRREKKKNTEKNFSKLKINHWSTAATFQWQRIKVACCLHKEIKMIEKREYKWPKDFNKDQKALRRDVVTMV